MKKEPAMLLVRALQGGKFQKGTGRLRRVDNSCCCLGVAEDVRGCRWELCGNSWAVVTYTNGLMVTDKAYMTSEGMSYYGMFTRDGKRRDDEPIIINGKEFTSLVDANDLGVSHHDIGEYIKNNWADL